MWPLLWAWVLCADGLSVRHDLAHQLSERGSELGRGGGPGACLPLVNPHGGGSPVLAADRKLQHVKTSGEGMRFQLIGTQFAELYRSWGELCLAPERPGTC